MNAYGFKIKNVESTTMFKNTQKSDSLFVSGICISLSYCLHLMDVNQILDINTAIYNFDFNKIAMSKQQNKLYRMCLTFLTQAQDKDTYSDNKLFFHVKDNSNIFVNYVKPIEEPILNPLFYVSSLIRQHRSNTISDADLKDGLISYGNYLNKKFKTCSISGIEYITLKFIGQAHIPNFKLLLYTAIPEFKDFLQMYIELNSGVGPLIEKESKEYTHTLKVFDMYTRSQNLEVKPIDFEVTYD